MPTAQQQHVGKLWLLAGVDENVKNVWNTNFSYQNNSPSNLITEVFKLWTSNFILSPAFLIVLTACSCEEFRMSVPSTAIKNTREKLKLTWNCKTFQIYESYWFRLYPLLLNAIVPHVYLPKIRSPTFKEPLLSAELSAIIFLMKIPVTAESPDTLT